MNRMNHESVFDIFPELHDLETNGYSFHLESKAFTFLIIKGEPGTDMIAPKKQRSHEKKKNQYDVSHLYLCCINPEQSVWILCFWRYNMLKLSILSGFRFKNRGFFFSFFPGKVEGFTPATQDPKQDYKNEIYWFSLHTAASFLNYFSILYEMFRGIS